MTHCVGQNWADVSSNKNRTCEIAVLKGPGHIARILVLGWAAGGEVMLPVPCWSRNVNTTVTVLPWASVIVRPGMMSVMMTNV